MLEIGLVFASENFSLGPRRKFDCGVLNYGSGGTKQSLQEMEAGVLPLVIRGQDSTHRIRTNDRR
jgi:hypothetical protein